MRACDWRQYKKGEYIIQEGDEDHSFYILLSGIVSVEKNELSIDHLQAGDCFGEMGYLTKTKRTASVRSSSDVSLIQVNAATLDRANESTQLRFLKVFVKTLGGKIDRHNQRTGQELNQCRKIINAGSFVRRRVKIFHKIEFEMKRTSSFYLTLLRSCSLVIYGYLKLYFRFSQRD